MLLEIDITMFNKQKNHNLFPSVEILIHLERQDDPLSTHTHNIGCPIFYEWEMKTLVQ